MTEVSGIQELTIDEIDSVSGAGWWTDFVNWVREHLFGQAIVEGNENGVEYYEGVIGLRWGGPTSDD